MWCVLLTVSTASAGTVVYVDDDAPLGGDGTTWNTAYRFLQDGLAFAADPENNVSEVRIGQGHYLPDRDEQNPDSTGDQVATFDLISDVAIRGGYAGFGAPDPDFRDIDLHETVFTGDLLGDDGDNFENNDDNSFHVMTGVGVNDASTIDGITITAGNAEDAPVRNGGGMILTNASPTVLNCTIAWNKCDTSFSTGYGGGVAVDGGMPAFESCTFEGNYGRIGGGVLAINCAALVLQDCLFSGNRTDGNGDNGGAVYCERSSATIQDCVFSENESAGAAGASVFHCDITVSNCSFTGNMATSGAGCLSIDRSMLAVTDCVFIDNESAFGAAMSVFDYSPGAVIDRCVFIDNFASNVGGALSLKHVNACIPVRIANCTFLGNSAEGAGGGAVYSNGACGDFINCVVSGNSTTGEGGAMQLRGGRPTLTGCTLSGNSSADVTGGIHVSHQGAPCVSSTILWGNSDPSGSGLESQVFAEDGSDVTVVYSCIQGFTETLSGVGNIGDDPLLADPDGDDNVLGTIDDDLHLLPDSPCINTGTLQTDALRGGTDLDGEVRIQACRVDMGADETAFAAAILQDCNRNGEPDECDIQSGVDTDCDYDGVPDSCQAGPDSDCDRNGMLDICQVTPGVFTAFSGELAPFGWQSPQQFKIATPPLAIGEVLIEVLASADLFFNDAVIDVFVNDVGVGRVFTQDGPSCGPAAGVAQLAVHSSVFNALVDGGDVTILLMASDEVDAFACDTFVSIDLSYPVLNPGDINLNGVPDQCDPDCNDNGVPDDLDLREFFVTESDILSPLGDEITLVFELESTPEAVARVQLLFVAAGDLASFVESVDIEINGSPVGTIFANSLDCVPVMSSLEVDAATFNMLTGGGPTVIEMTPSSFVNKDECDPGSTYIQVRLDIPIASDQDKNGNGIPDECEQPGDLDGDGIVGPADLAIVLGNWGPCPAPPDACIADLDGDGSVGPADLAIILGNWG